MKISGVEGEEEMEREGKGRERGGKRESGRGKRERREEEDNTLPRQAERGLGTRLGRLSGSTF